MLVPFILGILGVILFSDLLAFLLNYPAFKRELKYINMEIGRSEPDEMVYWKWCKKKLILSAFFFSYYR